MERAFCRRFALDRRQAGPALHGESRSRRQRAIGHCRRGPRGVSHHKRSRPLGITRESASDFEIPNRNAAPILGNAGRELVDFRRTQSGGVAWPKTNQLLEPPIVARVLFRSLLGPPSL